MRSAIVIGLIIAVVAVAASVHDNAIDAAVVEHGSKLGISVQIVARNPADSGFVPEPIRWRAEQTNGLNMMERRSARDYEHVRARMSCSESEIYRASAGVVRRPRPAPHCP